MQIHLSTFLRRIRLEERMNSNDLLGFDEEFMRICVDWGEWDLSIWWKIKFSDASKSEVTKSLELATDELEDWRDHWTSPSLGAVPPWVTQRDLPTDLRYLWYPRLSSEILFYVLFREKLRIHKHEINQSEKKRKCSGTRRKRNRKKKCRRQSLKQDKCKFELNNLLRERKPHFFYVSIDCFAYLIARMAPQEYLWIIAVWVAVKKFHLMTFDVINWAGKEWNYSERVCGAQSRFATNKKSHFSFHSRSFNEQND